MRRLTCIIQLSPYFLIAILLQCGSSQVSNNPLKRSADETFRELTELPPNAPIDQRNRLELKYLDEIYAYLWADSNPLAECPGSVINNFCGSRFFEKRHRTRLFLGA